ncbi:glycosyltransferase [Patescibacteria group bacterium]|nr:glycosyltransferase [Patescibacteria group bacterium]MBU1889976.1 glycosyltransferase [Patescibacteria group bacterium]
MSSDSKLDSKDFSIVIRTYNEERHVDKLLRSIYGQKTNKNFEVIIVDSGSTDATLDIAQKYPTSILRINPNDFSFGRSLNLGIAKTQGEIVILISAHCYPPYDNWITHITEPFQDKSVALVYGKQRGNHKTKYSENQIFKKMFPEQPIWKQTNPFCNNANTAIRRSFWKEVPYNEELTGLEDLDWANKMLKSGKTITYHSKATIIHVHEENPSRIYRRYQREAIALKKIFPETNFTFIDFIKLFPVNVGLDIFRAMRDEPKLRHLWEVPIFRFIQYWGTYRGYQYKKPQSENIKKFYYYPRSIKK